MNTTSSATCLMSFASTGDLVKSASDSFAMGRSQGPSNSAFAASATYAFSVTGSGAISTFTAKYRVPSGSGTWATSQIIVAVYD